MTAAPHAPRPLLRPSLTPLVVLLASLAVYVNAIDTAFVLDDAYWIQTGLKDCSLDTLIREASQNRRWLTRATFAANYFADRAAGGTGLRPQGYKLVNVLIHAGAALALFDLCRRLIDRPVFADRVRRAATWLATAIAVLWAVHPLQTQAVTYVIQRHESMMTMFFLLSLGAYVRAADLQSSFSQGNAAKLGDVLGWIGLAITFAAAGAWCKESIIVLPVVALVMDRSLLSGSFLETLRRRGWALAMLSFAVVWPMIVMGTRDLLPAGAAASGTAASAGFYVPDRSPSAYLLAQPAVILHYLKLTVWPRDLAIDYTGWRVPESLEEAIGPAAIILMLITATLWALFRKHWLGFIGAWFFLALAPASSFFPLADVAMEHRMYLPLAALSALAVGALAATALREGDAASGENQSAGYRSPAVAVAGVVFAVAVAVLGARTLIRNEDYATAATLYRSNTQVTPDNLRAWRNLASELLRENKPAETVPVLERAVELSPFDPELKQALGVAYLRANRPREAIAPLRQALALIDEEHARKQITDAAYHEAYRRLRGYLERARAMPSAETQPNTPVSTPSSAPTTQPR